MIVFGTDRHPNKPVKGRKPGFSNEHTFLTKTVDNTFSTIPIAGVAEDEICA